MAVWTAPKTWASGEVVTSGELNTALVENVERLALTPAFFWTDRTHYTTHLATEETISGGVLGLWRVSLHINPWRLWRPNGSYDFSIGADPRLVEISRPSLWIVGCWGVLPANTQYGTVHCAVRKNGAEQYAAVSSKVNNAADNLDVISLSAEGYINAFPTDHFEFAWFVGDGFTDPGHPSPWSRYGMYGYMINDGLFS